MDWVRSRLQICCGSHPTCPVAIERPFPNRILALDRSSGGKISVKVTELGNEAMVGVYATLSHCWGPELPCVTTTENRSQRRRGIPWTEIPQTFQDAIRYCLELEISYLWIDALCIIQDDPQDWQIESAKMAGIYENSYITLAATSSDCGSSGCFQEKSVADKERALQVPSAGGQVHQILIRQLIPHWTVTPTSSSKRENPLLSRSWVFQERILSPRVLHFCKQELVWECGQEIVCECGSIPKTRNLKLQFAFAARPPAIEECPQVEQRDDGSTPSEINPLQLIKSHSPQKEAATKKAINQWHNIVEQYSALDLTDEKDILPALSGLAERMAPFLGDYLAGLWRQSLLSDLCWRIDKLGFGPQGPAKYRGPSWSWVSRRAKVSFWTQQELTPRLTIAGPNQRHNMHNRRTSIPGPSAQSSRVENLRQVRTPGPDIVSCTVDAFGKNKFGEVSSALLLVDGYVKESSIWLEPMVIPNSAVPPSFEVELEMEIEMERADEVQENFSYRIVNGRYVPVPVFRETPGITLWRMAFFADYIFSSRRSDSHFSLGTVFLLSISPKICLVLVKTSLRLPHEFNETFIFRRIGILKIPHEFEVRYGVDVMKGSQRTRVAIV